MKKNILIYLFLLSPVILCAQTAMGKWNTYLAYNTVSQITLSDNKVFAISEGALFSVGKSDGDMEFYSKMSGLNDANISKIAYDEVNNQLVIIYQSGNIDIMYSGGIANIPDLYNKQMNTSKAINHISFYDDKAFLSTEFGIIALNLSKKEIADTYIIGDNATEIKVLATQTVGDKIFACSSINIYQADVNSPHLVNYEYWSKMTNLPGTGNIMSVFSFSNKLFMVRDSKIYQFDGISWSTILNGKKFTNWNVSDGKLILNDGTTSIYILDPSLTSSTITLPLVSLDVEYDGSNATYWLAGNDQGIISYTGGELSYFKPEGPAVNIPWDIHFAGSRMFVVPGGRWDVQYYRRGWVMMYENGRWENKHNSEIFDKTLEFRNNLFYDKATGYAIPRSANNPTPEFWPIIDFMNVAVDPKDSSHFFVTSYGTGLYEYKNDTFEKWHNHTNSTIESVVAANPYYYNRLDGAIFDSKGNLYLANMGTTSAVKILKNDGNWTELYYTESLRETLGRILISNVNENQKWIPATRKTPGIFIFDDNGTLDDQSDDKNRFMSTFRDPDTGGDIIPASYYCLAQDKDGTIWAGTDMGPLLFYNTSRAFETDYNCSRVKIPRNDGTELADYLLVNEKVKAIAIDGANRKWIGTEASGVYLMSENGQETVQHFTAVNSPLLSNDILSIAIHPKTGEVFFGTSMGIVSYQSDAAEGAESYSTVNAFPNPVRENYNGIITITGLIENSAVKIMDISGNLIYETMSNGSIATWNGMNVYGQKVRTGVYLVMAVNEDGTEGIATKIMVIR